MEGQEAVMKSQRQPVHRAITGSIILARTCRSITVTADDIFRRFIFSSNDGS